jgi:hypothetical protein
MALITLDQAKRQLDIASSDTSRDDELQLWVDATTSAVEKARGEVVDQRRVTDELPVNGGRVILTAVPVTALVSVTSVADGTTWDTSALHVTPATGELTVMSGRSLSGGVVVVYNAGYPSPPANYVVAALIILQHLWETRRGAQSIPMGGDNEMYVPQLGYAVPRRAVELLGLSLPGVA